MITLLVPLVVATTLTWLDPATVQPQQKGICVTEWTGGQRLEMPVEVMGVLDAPGPDRTTVLVRLDDPRLTGAGVVEGMSGSPVYIDGKLLGAVAFGWPFARAPLAGVTPFATMRSLSSSGSGTIAAPPALADIAGVASGRLGPLAALPTLAAPRDSLPLPVGVAGLPLPADREHDVLARLGLNPVPAAGRVALGGVPEAGDMVAALLVWGDAVVGAAGTVTAIEGNTLWAFGHPFLSLGAVLMPAARARVLAVQSSYQNSFKFFAVGDTFGSFVIDRNAGVVAEVGRPSDGLPVSVTVRGPGAPKTWSFDVARVPVLEPLLVTYLANASLTAHGAATGMSVVAATVKVRLADGRSIRVAQAVAGVDALARIAGFAGAVVGFLANSAFVHPDLAAVELDLHHVEQAESTTIVEAIPEHTVVRPGESLLVRVRLQPARHPASQESLVVQVPPTATEGRLDLIVADGAAWSEYLIKAEGLSPASFADQIAQIGMLESSRTLVAALESRESGVAMPGASQPALPPSWAATLETGLGSHGGLKRLRTAIVATSRWNAPLPLDGAFRIPLTVRARPTEVP